MEERGKYNQDESLGAQTSAEKTLPQREKPSTEEALEIPDSADERRKRREKNARVERALSHESDGCV